MIEESFNPTPSSYMPSRPAAALILLAWLATLGWFADRELRPLLFPSDAPPFVIELGDEVTSQLGGAMKRPDVLWGIYRNDKRIGHAETRLRYFREDNTFELETRVVALQLAGAGVEIPEMINAYRINRQGELRGLRMTGTMTVNIKLLKLSASGRATVFGEVRDGKLYRHGTLDIDGMGKVEPEFAVIDAPKGSVLNPMQPIPKVRGLHPGRRWRMPLIDPLDDAIRPTIKAAVKRYMPDSKIDVEKRLPAQAAYVDAEVLTETAAIDYNAQSFRCLIIEYRNESGTARTYVRESDGAVLRQEAFARGERIALQRE